MLEIIPVLLYIFLSVEVARLYIKYQVTYWLKIYNNLKIYIFERSRCK
jgi:hypothetical protein